MIAVYGLGHASERMNKRVRDDAFKSLVQQEVSYFDKRSVGKITSQLQEDAARVHTFTGEPVRTFLIAASAIVVGLALSFYFMWQFALLALACVPLMGFATSMETKNILGEDASSEGSSDGSSSPGAVIVETLLNISTVSALAMETDRFNDFERALDAAEPNATRDGVTQGALSGLSMFIQQWMNALQLWFGAWVLFNNLDQYEFQSNHMHSINRDLFGCCHDSEKRQISPSRQDTKIPQQSVQHEHSMSESPQSAEKESMWNKLEQKTSTFLKSVHSRCSTDTFKLESVAGTVPDKSALLFSDK